MDFSNAGATELLGSDIFRAHVQWKEKGAKQHIHGPRRPDEDAAKDDRYRRPSVAGGTVALPFGAKEIPNGTSLAMYPSVGSAFQAQGYVSKGRRFLSDVPFGRLS